MKLSKIRNVKTPNRGTEKSAGIDFFIPDEFQKQIIKPGESVLIPSGIRVNVPTGYMLTAFNKSGIATKKSLLVGACVVDEDYQGEIHIHLINAGSQETEIEGGQKIIQLILVPVFYDGIEEVNIEDLYTSVSERGEGGFGSTGTH
jgi:dUTP pyrophosphatase